MNRIQAPADNFVSVAPLRSARILVTGGAGFVGSRIVDDLIEAGCGSIVVVDNMVRGRAENLAPAMRKAPVRLIEGDICDQPMMARLINDCDIVFHQAALRITHCVAEPRLAMEVMVNATFSLLEQCVEAGVGKVIMASSASVYGLADAFPTTEQAPPYPNRTLYGAAKAFGEHLLRAFNDMHGLDYVALRYFNVYGPRMDIHGRYTEVMIRWMERISKGQPPIIFGDGLSTMDFIHVSDVAKANLLAATAPVSDRVFNVGSGRETSLLDLARLLCEVMGRPDLVPVHVEQRAVNNVGRRLADVEAARRHLGFTAAVPLRRGLADLVAWWRTSQERADADVAGLPS